MKNIILLLLLLYSARSISMPMIQFKPPQNNAAEAPDLNPQKELPKEGLRKPQPMETLKNPEVEEAVEPEFKEDFNSLEIQETTEE